MAEEKDIFRQQEEEIDGFIRRSESLRIKYDQYFMGLEKREPAFDREQLERELHRSKVHRTVRTGLRFKFQTFLARYRTYCAYWDRVLREMEEGTYRRGSTSSSERLAALQVEAARARAEGGVPAKPTEDDPTLGVEEKRILAAAREAEAFLASFKQRGRAPPAPPAPVEPAAMPYRVLFDEYVRARQATGEDVSKLTYGSFHKSVEKQRDVVKEKLGGDIEFRVKVVENKVTLVAGKRKPKAEG